MWIMRYLGDLKSYDPLLAISRHDTNYLEGTICAKFYLDNVWLMGVIDSASVICEIYVKPI